jgi:hypothetical protein
VKLDIGNTTDFLPVQICRKKNQVAGLSRSSGIRGLPLLRTLTRYTMRAEKNKKVIRYILNYDGREMILFLRANITRLNTFLVSVFAIMHWRWPSTVRMLM